MSDRPQSGKDVNDEDLPGEEPEFFDDFIHKGGLRERYGLTKSLVDRLGPPDETRHNRHNRANRIQLYRRARVEQWIVANLDLVEAAQERSRRWRAGRRGSVLGAAATAKPETAKPETAAATSPDTLRQLEAILLEHLRVYELPDLCTLQAEAASYYAERYGVFPHAAIDLVTHYARSVYSNYDHCLSALGGALGSGDPYDEIRAGLDDEIDDALDEAIYAPRTQH